MAEKKFCIRVQDGRSAALHARTSSLPTTVRSQLISPSPANIY